MIEKYNEICNKFEGMLIKKIDNILENKTYKVCKIGDLFYHIKPGTNYQPKRTLNGIPFLNVKNINNGYIDTTDSKLISINDYNFVHKDWKPEQGDIIISRIGTLGLVAAVEKNVLPFALHYNFISLRSKIIRYEFLYFFLKTNYFQNKYISIAKQSVQSYVTIDDFCQIEIQSVHENSLLLNECIITYQTIFNMRHKIIKLSNIKQAYLKKYFG